MSKPGAIKISLGAKKPPTKLGQDAKVAGKASNTAPAKRTASKNLAFGGDDDEHDDDDDEGKSVEVTHFDQAKGGAHHEEARTTTQSAKERIIECAPNRNWRDEATKKRQKSALPGRNQSGGADQDGGAGEQKMKYGLNVKAPNDASHPDHTAKNDSDQESRQPAGSSRGTAFDEQRVYEDDVQNAPEAPSLSDYDKVPVEGFGLAMLKGMGFKEKEKEEKKKQGAINVQRRPALLGIGAKPLEEDKKR